VRALAEEDAEARREIVPIGRSSLRGQLLDESRRVEFHHPLSSELHPHSILARLRLQPTDAWGPSSGQRAPGSRKTEALPPFVKPLSGRWPFGPDPRSRP